MEKETAENKKKAGSTSGRSLCVRKGAPLPLGVSRQGTGIQFAVSVPGAVEVGLHFYKKGRKEREYSVILDESFSFGSVFSVVLDHFQAERYEYMYEAAGREFIDPYAVKIDGRDVFGKVPVRDMVRAAVCLEDYDWEGDSFLKIPYEESILYQLHVRGFTRHSSSRVSKKGTFKGIEEKIPYLKELGINGLVLLPCYDFPEIMEDEMHLLAERHLAKYHIEEDEDSKYRMNYWGYGRGCNYFAPKTSYSSDVKKPVKEFRDLVKQLHRNGIEVIMDICFEEGVNKNMIIDCLRHWVIQFHVDGFKINDNVASTELAALDPLLAGTKLLATYWNTGAVYGRNRPVYKNLALYNDGYMVDTRRFLKGDEAQADRFADRTRQNPERSGVINYITNINGFTLMDLVSYDRKHNEANGENNRDGTNFNYSWNCGVEGKTRRRAVMALRKRQIKNAVIMLFFSQGTPMIVSGDEFGNSQEGNNNAYCHDNEISWLNWNQLKTNGDLYEFVKEAVSLRRNHRILHMPDELKVMDYISCGYPDISYHGTKAWYPDFTNYSRALGVMYCGKYARINGKYEDNFFYVVYNMHWESHEFALPKLPDKLEWRVVLYSSDQVPDQVEDGQKVYKLAPRSAIVFIGEKGTVKETLKKDLP